MPGLGLAGTILMGARSLAAQRIAMEVTGHNISNVNTPNAARQRANLVTDITINTSVGPQGSGSIVNRIESLRSDLLDTQTVRQKSYEGFYEKKLSLTTYLQDLLSENLGTDKTGGVTGSASNTGIQDSLNQFFEAWQALSSNPTSIPYREQVIERTRQLASDIRADYTRITNYQTEVEAEASSKATDINNYATTIAKLNQEIMRTEATTGLLANDLRDQRQEAVEQLSKLVSIKTSTNAINSSMIDIQIAQSNGTVVAAGAVAATNYLVKGLYSIGNDINGNTDAAGQTASVDVAGGTPTNVTLTNVNGTDNILASTSLGGELGALIDVDNYAIGTTAAGGGILQNLETFADEIISTFNALHTAGFDLNGVAGANLFSGAGAANIDVNITDPKEIAASSANNQTLDGSNAMDIANERLNAAHVALGNISIEDYYRSSIVADTGFLVQQAERDNKSQTLVMQQLTKQREAVSGISIDEEMANLVRFQRAYEASARFVSVADEMLSRVVNGLGAGR